MPSGSKTKIRLSPWFCPYHKNPKTGKQKTSLKLYTDSKCGAYMIRSKRTKEILYVGYSASQLYKTLYRHFQNWLDNQSRTVYKNPFAYQVMIITNPNCNNAFLIEQYYLQKHQPRDNANKEQLNLLQASFSGMPRLEKIEIDEVVPF